MSQDPGRSGNPPRQTRSIKPNVPRRTSENTLASAMSLVALTPGGKQVPYNDAFEMTGHGRFNNFALLCGAFIFVHALVEMIAIAYVLSPAECDLNLDVSQKSLINLSTFLGIIITSICWGSISDNYGRRKIMIPTLFCAIVFSICSSMCTNFVVMFTFRVLTGSMVSATSAIVPVYMGELITKKHRDMYIALSIAASQAGFVVCPGIAWLIIPQKWSFDLYGLTVKSWRTFMWTWSLVGIIGLILLLQMPESPRFVLSSRGALQALPILARMYAKNKKKKPENFPVTSIKTVSAVLLCGGEKKSIIQQIFMLLKYPLRRCVILTHGSMFVTFTLANGIYLWIPDLFNTMLGKLDQFNSVCNLIDHHISANASTGECEEEILVYPLSMGVEFYCLIPFIIVIYIVEKVHTVNKNKLYAILMVWNGCWIIISTAIPHMIISMIALCLGLASAAAIAILSALVVDAYPTALRGMAMCTMFMAGQLGAMFGNAIMSCMFGNWCYILFLFTGLLVISSALGLVKFWPDINAIRIEMEAKDYYY